MAGFDTFDAMHLETWNVDNSSVGRVETTTVPNTVFRLVQANPVEISSAQKKSKGVPNDAVPNDVGEQDDQPLIAISPTSLDSFEVEAPQLELENYYAAKAYEDSEAAKLESYRRAIANNECGDLETQPEACYYQNPPSGMIGSILVPKNAAPFLVQIARSNFHLENWNLRLGYPDKADWELEHMCGGALIDKEWVLTAAHCFGDLLKHFDQPLPAKRIKVRLDAKDISDKASKKVDVEQIFIHEDYSDSPLVHDIALVKIKTRGLPLILRDIKYLEDWQSSATDIKKVLSVGQGDHFVIVTQNGTVTQGNIKTKTVKRGLYPEGDKQPTGFKVEPDRLMIWDKNKAWFRSYSSWKDLPAFDHGGPISEVFYISEINRLITVSENDHNLKVWNSLNRTLLSTIEYGKERGVIDSLSYIEPSQNLGKGRIILAHRGGRQNRFNSQIDPEVTLWNLGSKTLIKAYASADGVKDLPKGVKSSETVLSFAKTFKLIDLETGKIKQSYSLPDKLAATWLENGKQIVSVSKEHVIRVHDISRGKTISEFDGSRPSFEKNHRHLKLTYHPESQRLLLLNKVGQIQVWDVKRKKLLLSTDLKMIHSHIHARFFNGGRKLLVWVDKGRSRIWNLNSQKDPEIFEHSLPMSGVNLTKDEKELVTYGKYGISEVWDLAKKRPVQKVFHGGLLKGAQLTRNDDTLLTWGENGLVKAWSLKTGQEIFRVTHLNFDDEVSPQVTPETLKPTLVSLIGPNTERINEYQSIVTYGWGKTKHIRGFQPSALLMAGGVQRLGSEECIEKTKTATSIEGWKFLGQSPYKETIFCGHDKFRKTCKGDSGGPLISNNRLVGIVSTGSGNCYADDLPGLYTRVDYYTDWIKEKICTVDNPNRSLSPICL